MVARRAGGRVPRFASLKEFIFARTWYHRGAFQFLPGPERDDLEERMRRHGISAQVRSRYVLTPQGIPVLRG